MQLLDSAIDGALGLEKEADQKDAAWALLTYMRTGELPEDLRQNAAAIMAAVLPALELSRARAEAPKNRGKKSSKSKAKAEQGDVQTGTKKESKPEQQAEQNAEQIENKTETNSGTKPETKAATNAKRRGRGIEDTYVSSSPYSPPNEFLQAEADGDYAFASFAKACIDAFNEETGQDVRSTGGTLWTDLRRIYDSGRTVDDVRAVVRKKLAVWGDDPKMAKYVRPSTLFGCKFEEYLNEQEVTHGTDLGEYASAF